MKHLSRRRPSGRIWPTSSQWFHDEIERMLDRFFGEVSLAEVPGSCLVDIWENADYTYIEAELPGMEKEDVQLTFEAGLLTITAEKKRENHNGQDDLSERYFGRIYRCLALPSAVHEDSIKAAMKDGVLRITLFKTERSESHRIPID